MHWQDYFPIAEHLKGYNKRRFRLDVVAGLTVCIMLVPQAMAYALLAGVPPIYGLYTALIPLLIYGMLGTSRQVSIGPVAVSSLLVLAGISQVADPGSARYIELVILSGLLIGLMQLLLGALRLGFLVNLLSHPVIMGFTSAAAIIIAVSQLKYLFGMEVPRLPNLLETISYVFSHLSEIHWLSFAFCTGGIVLILVLKWISPAFPGALLITVLGILCAYLFDLGASGLKTVGDIPKGLPHFSLPAINSQTLKLVAPTVLTVTIIGIVEAIGIAKALEIKNKDTVVKPNQELFAMGTAKVLGALFQSIPSSASFTRSAINNESGASSGLASIVTALATALVLLFFTPLFYYLPEAILAAIILLAIRSLFDVQGIARLWKIDRRDFTMAVVTFLATIGLGIAEGVLTGVVLSLLSVLYQSSRPHIAVLGQLPDSSQFRNIKRFPEAIQFDGILIIRFDASLFFLNIDYFKEQIKSYIAAYDGKLHTLLLDTSSIINIDSSGLEAIRAIHDYCREYDIQLFTAGTMGPVRDILARAGLDKAIGYDHHFLDNIDAVEFAKEEDH